MKKDISKTTKTQKQGNGKRKQLRETKRNVAGLETATKQERPLSLLQPVSMTVHGSQGYAERRF